MRNKMNVSLKADEYIEHKHMNAVRQILKIDLDPSKDLSTLLLVGTWLELKWDARREQDA